MADQNPLLSYYMMQDPVAALMFQQQQMLAQQMMQQGSEYPDPSKMIGNIVAPVSPVEYASKAIEKGLSGYLQGANIAKLGALMRTQGSPQQQSGSPQQSGAAIGAQMQAGSPLNGLPSVTGDPMKDWFISQSNPELFKALASRTAPTDLSKNVTNPVTAPYVAKDALVEGGKGYLPASALMPQNANPMLPAQIQAESGGNPNAVSPRGAQGIAQIMPATAANPGYGVPPLQGMQNGNPMTAPVPEQLRFANDYDNAMQKKFGNPQLAAAAYNAGPGRVQQALGHLPPETQNYVSRVAPTPQQLNDPTYMAKAKKQAEEEGGNIGEAEKGVAGIDARLQGAMDILDQQKELNAQKGHGLYGEYIGVPASRNLGSGKEAAAQTQFEQNNANLFTQELPSIMAGMPGSRMDIPLINAIKNASQIPEYASNVETNAAIDNLKSQLQRYQGNTHKNLAALGGANVPIPPIANGAPSQNLLHPQDIVDELRSRGLVK